MNKLLVAEKLREAAAVVDTGWTRHHFAVDADGAEVSANHRAACKWCAVGAIQKVFPPLHDGLGFAKFYGECLLAADNEARITTQRLIGVAVYNDVHADTAADVSGLLRRAAARLEAEAITNG